MSSDFVQHLFNFHKTNPHVASHLGRVGSHPVLSNALFGAYKAATNAQKVSSKGGDAAFDKVAAKGPSSAR
jgi:hypothetical protein